ncbi:MAG: ribonuclease D [Wolbachia sp.]|nr:ribonuclease D [Wolbachia sp.]MDD9336220.1 ribonuclease D [Wolbachia sp.]
MLINTTLELEEICEELVIMKPKFIAVDTEFIRNNVTYYPKLSLIQVSYGSKSFIVDALASEIDLSPIKKIMLDKEIIKVFHSCRQDMESLLTVLKNIPISIFDTQIAAMLCNYYHDFISYSKVVEQYKGVVLDKMKAKNSDWLKRPLSEDQVDYAINDVIHLYDLYQILRDELGKNERVDWFQEEMKTMGDINRYLHSPKDAWKRIKFNCEANPKMILTVNALSEWQETLAQRYNVNRNRIIDSSVISGLIEKNVVDVDEILDDLEKNMRSVNMRDKKEECLLEFMSILNKNKKIFTQQNNISIKSCDQSVFDILSILLESKCKENNISRKLVASKDELIKSISGQIDRLFKGWRYDFFGKSIKSFLNTDSKFEISAAKSASNMTKIQSRLIENDLVGELTTLHTESGKYDD